jgi:hypothetical protein
MKRVNLQCSGSSLGETFVPPSMAAWVTGPWKWLPMVMILTLVGLMSLSRKSLSRLPPVGEREPYMDGD